jgi:geranylgeranyl diphosphate synthase type II
MSELDTPSWFREVLSYYLFPGGKRLRPSISMALCEDLGGNLESCARASISLELIHASSLIHDDLPALDNDDYRRGRESCHKRFGEANAILAGDALMMLAFKTISTAGLISTHDADIHRIISDAGFSICVGQVLDMLPEKGAAAEIDIVNRKKTAALFEASFVLGAICAGAGSKAKETFTELGLQFGRAFQLLNDFEDHIPTASGRPTKSDSANSKVTILTRPAAESSLLITELMESIDASMLKARPILPENSALLALIGPFVERLRVYAKEQLSSSSIASRVSN